MKLKKICRSTFIVVFFAATFLTANVSGATKAEIVSSAPMFGSLGTWDGGGTTNNWSEAANWTADTLPTNSTPVVFDGTSSKDVVFDIALARAASTTVTSGYTGTLSNGSTNLNFAAAFAQDGGTFTGGSGNLTFGGTFTQTGGSFSAGSGTLDVNGNFSLSGGTFTQSSNLNLFSSFNFLFDSTAVFNHNSGTFVIDGPFNFNGTATALDLFILRVGATHNFGSKTLIANETLELNSGNAVDGTLEARKNLVIAANYTSTANVLISGNLTRTIILPMTANMPRFTINAPSVTVEPSSTSGTLTFGSVSFSLQNGTFNANGVNVVFTVPFLQSGGTFNGGSGNLSFNGAGTMSLTGGTFNATSGTLTYNPFSSTFNIGATFNPNGGTFVVNAPTNFNGTATTMNFHNFTANANFGMGSRSFNVAGTLNLVSSSGGNGIIEAAGNVVIGSAFTGGSGAIRFVGSGVQTYTNNGGVNPTGIWTLNKNGGTVNLATDLDISNGAPNFILTNGTITTGANTVIVGSRAIFPNSGFIIGGLRQSYTAAVSKAFPVGTANGFAPVTVTPLAGTFGAATTFTVRANDGTLAGASPTNSITRNWTLNPSAGGITTATIQLNYLQSDVPVTANENSFQFLRRNAGVTTTIAPTTSSTAANFFTLNGVTQFSDWSLGATTPTAADSTITGRARTADGRGIGNATLTLIDTNGVRRIARTNPFGHYRFTELESGETYVLTILHKTYPFANSSVVVSVTSDISDLDFVSADELEN